MNDKLNKKELSLDEFGRLIIDGDTDLGLINGAAITHFDPSLDAACHDNAGCGDAACGNASCNPP